MMMCDTRATYPVPDDSGRHSEKCQTRRLGLSYDLRDTKTKGATRD